MRNDHNPRAAYTASHAAKPAFLTTIPTFKAKRSFPWFLLAFLLAMAFGAAVVTLLPAPVRALCIPHVTHGGKLHCLTTVR